MKGLIFREFLNMVEQEFGYETADSIIENSKLNSKGIYTNVGTYSHTEIFKLVEQLSLHLKVPAPKLFHTFGIYAFGVFAKSYHTFIEKHNNAFSLLSSVESTIHVEVLKLYPQAELPHFSIEKHNYDILEMVYTSQRKMGDFAEGLIQGCLNHYNEQGIIEKETLVADQSKIIFRITKNHE